VSDIRSQRLEAYTANLQEYLEGAGETALKKGYEMARVAMAEGVGVLDMAALHHEAMARVMHGAFRNETGSQRLIAAETLFVECLSPFEMTHRAFRESNTALRLLNEKLEEEANRIAHALHAEASQLLVSSYLVLESVTTELPLEVHHHLSKLRSLLDQISGQIRRLSHELRPTILEDLGLLPALRFLAEGVSARSRIPVTVEGELDDRPAPAVETAIYRVVQEALSNMTKHAHATKAAVHIQKEHGKIVCSVRDDGTGFDEAAVFSGQGTGGIGLLGIRERIQPLRGTLRINSAAGLGTEMVIVVPTEG
jgi:signal transduction histidine kinase